MEKVKIRVRKMIRVLERKLALSRGGGRKSSSPTGVAGVRG